MLPAADAEDWLDAYTESSPFWPLTRWERRVTDLLWARGLDGYAAHLVTLANRIWWDRSPWWWLVGDLVWEVHGEWAAAVEAGTA